MQNQPPWWDWDLELSPHLLKRMLDRGFTEVDLRLMLENAETLHENGDPDRWIVATSHGSKPWEVIVEPDMLNRVVVIVTAYPLEVP